MQAICRMTCKLMLSGFLLTLATLAGVQAQDPFAAANGGAAANGNIQPPADNGLPADVVVPGSDFQDIESFFDSPDAPADSRPFGTVDGNVTRLRYTGTGIISFTPEPIPPTGAVSLACSLGYLSDAFLGSYVAAGSAFYNKGFGCGQCIRLQCDDEGCVEVGKQMTAMVVDLCGDCFDADLSIAQPLFTNLTGSRGPNALVSWEWVPCGELIQGNIKMLQKPGGTAFYQAFSFSNNKQPVVAVRMNNELLKRSQSGNWWEWNPGQAINPRGPFKLDLLGNNRQVLSISIPQLRPTDLGVQFDE